MKFKSYFVKNKENIAKLYNKNKKLFAVIVVLFIVVFGYLFFGYTEKSDKNNLSETQNIETEIVSDYEKYLENKLEQMLLSIGEVSVAKVMVVCDSAGTYNFLKNVSVTENTGEKNGTKTLTEEVVFEKDGSNSKPVLERFDYPKVVGVMVVVKGASPSTKLSIVNSISVVLNVESSCINIVVD